MVKRKIADMTIEQIEAAFVRTTGRAPIRQDAASLKGKWRPEGPVPWLLRALGEPYPVVYFIKSGDFVKIGCSGRPAERFASLQRQTPHDLELLAVIWGGKKEEFSLHERFAAYHHRAEWFCLEGGLAEYVEGIADA